MMFRAHSIRDVLPTDGAEFTSALTAKLLDIEAVRIADNDALVLRKAVFGLLELVGELEARLVALEGPGARQQWAERLAEVSTTPTPDEVRLGLDDELDKERATDSGDDGSTR